MLQSKPESRPAPLIAKIHNACRLVKRGNEARGNAGLFEVRLAYEFSLDTVGQDIGAGSLWQVGVIDRVCFLAHY